MPENMKSLNGYRFDAEKLNGKPGSEYASAEDLNQLKGEIKAYRTAVNLLDNSDFMNFIAQAGIGGNHGTQAYAGDRWMLVSGTVTKGSGGLVLNGTIRQKIPNAPGVATPAIGVISGTAEIGYDNGDVTITSDGGELAWASLYAGSYTSDTIPPYAPKGYAAELAECRRYYYTIRADGANYASYGTGVMKTDTIAFFSFIFHVPMRIIPSMEYSDNFRVYVNGLGTPITEMSINEPSKYSTRVTIEVARNGVLGQACELQSDNDATSYIAFSADL